MSSDDIPEELPDPLAVALPIEHLFSIDPLQITAEDQLLLVQHYRRTRLDFLKLEEKPKAVQKNRNPKLTAEESAIEASKMLEEMFGFSADDLPERKAKK